MPCNSHLYKIVNIAIRRQFLMWWRFSMPFLFSKTNSNFLNDRKIPISFRSADNRLLSKFEGKVIMRPLMYQEALMQNKRTEPNFFSKK